MKAYILLNETGAVQWFCPRPLYNHIWITSTFQSARGGAMTPPVCQWSAGSCSLSRWSEVFGEVELVGQRRRAERLVGFKTTTLKERKKKSRMESWRSTCSYFYLLAKYLPAFSRENVSTFFFLYSLLL